MIDPIIATPANAAPRTEHVPDGQVPFSSLLQSVGDATLPTPVQGRQPQTGGDAMPDPEGQEDLVADIAAARLGVMALVQHAIADTGTDAATPADLPADPVRGDESIRSSSPLLSAAVDTVELDEIDESFAHLDLTEGMEGSPSTGDAAPADLPTAEGDQQISENDQPIPDNDQPIPDNDQPIPENDQPIPEDDHGTVAATLEDLATDDPAGGIEPAGTEQSAAGASLDADDAIDAGGAAGEVPVEASGGGAADDTPTTVRDERRVPGSNRDQVLELVGPGAPPRRATATVPAQAPGTPPGRVAATIGIADRANGIGEGLATRPIAATEQPLEPQTIEVQAPLGPRHAAPLIDDRPTVSRMAERIETWIRTAANTPPPRSITLRGAELHGLAIRVSLTSGGLAIQLEGASSEDIGWMRLVLDQLTDRGFDITDFSELNRDGDRHPLWDEEEASQRRRRRQEFAPFLDEQAGGQDG